MSYPAATASDAVSAPEAIALSYDVVSGTTFPIGTSTVTVTGTDEAGNAGRCTFRVIVVDSTPPTLTSCPSNALAEASTPAGAVVGWAPVVATDLETPSPVIAYSAAPGSTFPIGTTDVTVTATDLGGQTDSCTFTVTVVDTTPPVVSCAGLDTLAEATAAEGAAVGFPPALASDAATATVALAYAADVGGALVPAPPGATFPLGTTSLVATATDGAGNTASCTFTVTVRDTTAPLLSCPAPMAVEALAPGGAPATFTVTAVDAVDPGPVVTFTSPPGSTFPIGRTDVSVGAQDAFGNLATCGFAVTVADTKAPALTCPADVTVEASGPTPVDLPEATATDLVTADPTVTTSHPSGAVFPGGATLVTYAATDAAGNAASCGLTVTVVVTSRDEGGGCGSAGASGSGSLALGALVVLALRGRRRREAAR